MIYSPFSLMIQLCTVSVCSFADQTCYYHAYNGECHNNLFHFHFSLLFISFYGTRSVADGTCANQRLRSIDAIMTNSRIIMAPPFFVGFELFYWLFVSSSCLLHPYYTHCCSICQYVKFKFVYIDKKIHNLNEYLYHLNKRKPY